MIDILYVILYFTFPVYIFRFMKKNNIDPYKIVITGASNLPYKTVEPVTSLLTKREYCNYHIIVKE